MLQPLLGRLYMTEHHGRRGPKSLFVGLRHDLDPLIGAAFPWGDSLPDPVGEDLRTAAGNGIKPRRDQPPQDQGDAQA